MKYIVDGNRLSISLLFQRSGFVSVMVSVLSRVNRCYFSLVSLCVYVWKISETRLTALQLFSLWVWTRDGFCIRCSEGLWETRLNEEPIRASDKEFIWECFHWSVPFSTAGQCVSLTRHVEVFVLYLYLFGVFGACNFLMGCCLCIWTH